MSSKKSKLGSMFQAAQSIKQDESFESQNEAAAIWVPINKLIPGKMQPRSYFDEDSITDLANTFRITGFKGTINVREVNDGNYEIIAGERRWKAAQKAGLEKVACIVDDYSDEEALEFGLLENVLREDLSTLETLEGVLKLLQFRHGLPVGTEESRQWVIDHLNAEGHPDRRGTGSSSEEWQITKQTLEFLSLTIDTVLKWLRLLKIPDPIRQAHVEGKLAFTKALEIAKLKNENLWRPLLEEAIKQKLSKRAIIERVKEIKAEASPKPKRGKADKVINRMSAVQKRAQKASDFWKDKQAVSQLEEKLAEIEKLLESLGA
ncbi:MAG: ParB/RepB/Spo0J family partition protein [Leptolyngbya sp. SIO4C1]|nr:ParB/RepB/Spo0J family partition protein [Leptolyngbya sp. SIO4C1]